MDELVNDGVLESGPNQVFRREKTAAVRSGENLLFHQRQGDAIRKANEGRNYVLTTGTGSGKSLSCIATIHPTIVSTRNGKKKPTDDLLDLKP